MGLPPLGDDYEPNSNAGILPTWSPMFALFVDGYPPLGDDNSSTRLRALSRLAPWGVETLRCGIVPRSESLFY